MKVDIFSFRKLLGLTQKELGHFCGRCRAYMNTCEKKEELSSAEYSLIAERFPRLMIVPDDFWNYQTEYIKKAMKEQNISEAKMAKKLKIHLNTLRWRFEHNWNFYDNKDIIDINLGLLKKDQTLTGSPLNKNSYYNNFCSSCNHCCIDSIRHEIICKCEESEDTYSLNVDDIAKRRNGRKCEYREIMDFPFF